MFLNLLSGVLVGVGGSDFIGYFIHAMPFSDGAKDALMSTCADEWAPVARSTTYLYLWSINKTNTTNTTTTTTNNNNTNTNTTTTTTNNSNDIMGKRGSHPAKRGARVSCSRRRRKSRCPT